MSRLWLITLAIGALVICAFPMNTPARAGTEVCTWHDPHLRAQEYAAAKAVWRMNLKRQEALVHPSSAYAGVWLRDSFWVFLGLDEAPLARHALAHFADRQLSSGQLPTQFAVFLHKPLYRPDESTLLFLIWADWLAQHHDPLAHQARLKLALSYMRHNSRMGWYLSQPGSYASWFDGFKLPHVDSLSYNQGLYVVALMAAKDLGLGVDSREVTTALARYRDLANGHDGYLRFSRGLDYHDISGLVGDFLALWLFHTPMLSTAAVDATLRSQPSFASGFKVVTDGHGRPLPHAAFVRHFFPGDYQNGGSWLLFDYLALADGCLRGIPDMGDRMAERLHTEFQHRVTFHEYLNTDPHSPLFQHEPVYRDTFSWDTFVLRIDAIVSGLPC
jgi:hypothetical protein